MKNSLAWLKRRFNWFILVAAACASVCLMAWADFLPETTLRDLAGLPSRPALARGWRHQQRSRLQFQRVVLQRNRRRSEIKRRRYRDVQRARDWIRLVNDTPARRPPKSRVPIQTPDNKRTGQSAKKAGKRAVPGVISKTLPSPPSSLPSPPPVTLVEVPRQILSLQLVNPLRQPVRGLHLTVQIQPKTGPSIRLGDLTTDAQGQIKIAAIPIPAVVELLLRDDNPKEASDETLLSSTATSEPSDLSTQHEWDFTGQDAGVLEVLAPAGRRVGQRVASLSSRFARTKLGRSNYCGARLLQREVIYEVATPQIIQVTRNAVDITLNAPPGNVVSSPLLSQPLSVPASGILNCRLWLADLQEGAVPLRVSGTLAGGEAEAIISSYPMDPYASNLVACPPLQLVRLTTLSLPNRIGVFNSGEVVARVFGELPIKKDKNKPGVRTPLTDGSEWWIYGTQGVGFKMRAVTTGKKGKSGLQNLVERVRVFREGSGMVGMVGVGSSVDEVRHALGQPEVENDPRHEESDALSPAGTIDTYLNRGLRLSFIGGKVNWFEVARPTELLAQGTTAFASRAPARLFVEGFVGHPRTGLETGGQLMAYLLQVHSVELVNRREDADLVLRARVSNFAEDRDQITDLMPYRYSCHIRLNYGLFDVAQNRWVVPEHEVTASASADYTTQILEGGIVAGLLGKYGGKAGKIGAGLMVGGGLYELRRQVQKAINRCPGMASRSAFNTMVTDINRTADFAVRVTGINYSAGTLQINAGRDRGVQVGDQFQISVGDIALPVEENGLSADYYIAKVRSVGEGDSLCEMRHVQRKVGKVSEKFQETLDLQIIKSLPDPATGVVAARSWVQFPQIPIITNQDVERSLQLSQQREDPQQQKSMDTAPNDDPLGYLLDKVLKKKKK